MKKIIAILALGATFPVMASGIYVGGQAGWTKFKADYQDTSSVSYKDTAFIGGLYAGYEFDMDQFFFAVEGDYNFGDAKKTEGTVEYKRGKLYGISGLIGMPVNQDFDLYGRVGWARTKFTYDDSAATKETSNENGYSLGVGGRYHLTDQMGVRLEYRYNGYSKFKFDGIDVDNKNKEHMLTVGLQYSF